MKIQVPHPHAPAFLHHHHRDAAPAGEEHHTFKEEISHVVEKTLDTVEKGVDAVDPLHVFSPNEIPTRLVLPENLFSHSSGDAAPLLCARSNKQFHHLQVKPTENNILEIDHATTKKPVLYIERTHEPLKYDIYMPSDETGDLKHVAYVVRNDKVLGVIMEGDSEPTYVISKAGLAALYATKHWIKRVGEKEAVAATHPWQGTKKMLEVQPGQDVLFFFGLATIADEMIA